MSNKPNLFKMAKVDPLFDKEIEEIIRARWGSGIDKRMPPRALIQRKMIRHPLWLNLKMDLKKVRFEKEDGFQ